MNTPEPAENNTQAPSSSAVPEADQASILSESEALKIEAEKYKDLALRSQAELDNYRKRIVREKEDAIRYANAALLERLLPIVDSFELGLEAAKGTDSSSGSILVGMTMVQKQLLDFLRDSGVQIIETVGLPFDPNFHEAVSQEHSDEVQEGNIIRQLRNGYKLRDRLLRPSIVVVSKGTANS